MSMRDISSKREPRLLSTNGRIISILRSMKIPIHSILIDIWMRMYLMVYMVTGDSALADVSALDGVLP